MLDTRIDLHAGLYLDIVKRSNDPFFLLNGQLIAVYQHQQVNIAIRASVAPCFAAIENGLRIRRDT